MLQNHKFYKVFNVFGSLVLLWGARVSVWVALWSLWRALGLHLGCSLAFSSKFLSRKMRPVDFRLVLKVFSIIPTSFSQRSWRTNGHKHTVVFATSWFPGSIGYPVSQVPGYQGSRVPWVPVPWVPGYLGSQVPRCGGNGI